MRDKTHLEQVKRMAEFVRDNPSSWKKEHSEFINAQVTLSWEFYKRLMSLPGGELKIQRLRKLKE